MRAFLILALLVAGQVFAANTEQDNGIAAETETSEPEKSVEASAVPEETALPPVKADIFRQPRLPYCSGDWYCTETPEGDRRIRMESYDARQVYKVYTAVGVASLIQFEDGESLEISPASVLGIGDAAAWNLGVRGNNVVLKPVTKRPKTNIILVTDKRTYALDLLPTDDKTPPTYVLRFSYPDTEAALLEAEQKRAAITADARAAPRQINTDYVWRGLFTSSALAPTGAWDDGRFTRLIYDHAGEMPVFFKVLPDGKESLLNYNVDPKEKSTIVLHEVIRTVRARLNAEVIEIINKSYRLPEINRTGAGEHGAVRQEKERRP